jgi:AcrR family transcriptional regulator
MYEMSPRPKSDEKAERKAERRREAMARAEESVSRAEARVEEATERAAEQVERATERAAQKVERARRKMDVADGAAEGTLIWLRDEPSARRPSHTRADIARAAVEIADTEGFEAVSMRRVAERLGAGTMTLYHYVRNKDELIALMGDVVMADVVVPEDELSDHWRTALTQIATRTRAAFADHHWIFERMSDGAPGPNGMRHFDQSLQAVASLDLDREQTFELIGQVDDYVVGHSLREVQEREEHERGFPPAVIDFFQREVDTGNYPHIEKFFGTNAAAAMDEVLEMVGHDGRFERGLTRLLDGIEAGLPKNR